MAAFKYDDAVLVCDANDENGTLKGNCQQMSIDNFEKEYAGDKKYLGRFEISKQEVKDNVEELKNYGPYDFLTNNCQKWLRVLLKKTTVPDSPGLIEAKTGLKAFLGALLFAGVGYSIYTYLKPNERELEFEKGTTARYHGRTRTSQCD